MKISYPLNLPFQISQRWGENPEYYSQLNMKGHNGVDFAVQIGTPIYSCHNGTIQFSGIDSVRSLTVSVDSTDGTLRTLYCHLSESKVKVGQVVKRGELIALSGNTGSFTTGPHLHLGVRPLPASMDNGWNGAANPFNYFDGTYPDTVVSEAVPTKPQCEFQTVINYGSRGRTVQKLQDILKYEGFFKMESTGYFGDETAKAVVKWQTKHGMNDFVGMPLRLVRIGTKSRELLNKLYK